MYKKIGLCVPEEGDENEIAVGQVCKCHVCKCQMQIQVIRVGKMMNYRPTMSMIVSIDIPTNIQFMIT